MHASECLFTVKDILMYVFRKSANRYVTVSKKDSSIISEEATAFSLMKNTRSQIMNMMQKFPLTSKEKQDLQPRTERGQHYEGITSFKKICVTRQY